MTHSKDNNYAQTKSPTLRVLPASIERKQKTHINYERLLGTLSRLRSIDVAAGVPVRAAGEVKVVNGEIKYIDNSSGHYLPRGTSAQQAAENAFNQLGFNTIDKYIEKLWVEDPALPRGGAWRPQP